MDQSQPNNASQPNNTRLIPGMLVAFLLPMALLLPFLGKAFHVDDPLFVWTAQQIVEQPLNFYGFKANWERTAVWMYQIQQNPPLLSYYLAPWGAFLGWQETIMHLALLPLAGLCGLGMYLLARSFCSNPLFAAVVAIVSPGFLVSATQVMSDVPMLTLFVWSLYLWIRGLERDSVALCVAAAVCIGLGALTKYFAASAVPLLLVYTLLQGPAKFRYLIYFLIPFFMLVAYEFMTYRLYGLGLLADAFSFAQEHRATQRAALPEKMMNTIVFTGGCLMPVLCLLPWMFERKQLQNILVAMGIVMAVCFVLPTAAPEWLNAWHPIKITYPLNFDDPGAGIYRTDFLIRPLPIQLAQWGLWFSTGVLILALFVLDFAKRRDALALTLLLWFLGTFLFVSVINHHVNARVVLPLAPAVGLVCLRRMEWLSCTPAAPHPALRVWPLAPALVLSLVLAVADYRLAASAKQAAQDIMAHEHTGTVWFSGHSGFQYYMEEHGAYSIDITQSFGMPGDLFVQPSNNWYPLLIGPHIAGRHEVIEYETLPFVTTSHFQRYAGFYSDYSGPVPFMFGSVPMEQYLLVEIRLQIDIEAI